MTNRSPRFPVFRPDNTTDGAPISRRQLLQATASFGISTALLSLLGCGGGRKHNDSPTLTGNAAFRAIAVAGMQSLASGRAYPLAAMKLVAPTGSVFHPASANRAKILPKGTRAVPADRTYDNLLQLYKAYTESGGAISVAYSTDADGAISAGTASVRIQGASTVDTNYAAYPVIVDLSADITAGVLPFSGTMHLAFQGPTGANSLTGDFTLPRNNIHVAGTLTLSDSAGVGGHLDLAENGATLHLTEISGSVDDTLTSPITCEPYGWTGTGTFNLQTGQFSITMNTGSGTSTATSDDAGNLVLHFADGSTQTITNPLAVVIADLDSGNSSPSPSPSATPRPNPTYSAPVFLGAVSPTKINNNNQIVAFRNADAVPVYLPDAGAVPQVLGGGVALAGNYIYSEYSSLDINDLGQIIAYGYRTGGPSSYYWSSPGASAQALGGTSAGGRAINNGGTIAGSVDQGQSTDRGAIWTDPSTPVALQSAPGADFNDHALGVNSGGLIVGQSDYDNHNVPIYWHSSGEAGRLLALPDELNIATVMRAGVNDNGQIFAYLSLNSLPLSSVVYWSGPSAAGQILPGSPTLDANYNSAKAFGMNASGVIAGSTPAATSSSGSNGAEHAVVWKNQQPVDLNDYIPDGTGWVLTKATSINDQGVIVGVGTLTQNGTTQTAGFVLRPL